MYAGAAAQTASDREEFLLGKAVTDSHLPKSEAQEAASLSAVRRAARGGGEVGGPSPYCACHPSVAQSSEVAGAAFMLTNNANTDRDTARKVRADPLFAIKKKEQESVRDIMNNPLRMKQLQLVRRGFPRSLFRCLAVSRPAAG